SSLPLGERPQGEGMAERASLIQHDQDSSTVRAPAQAGGAGSSPAPDANRRESLTIWERAPTKGSRLSSQIKRGANRAYVLARLRRDGRADLIDMVESGALSVRSALAAMTDKQTSGH